ncbi:4149_t:CDS:2, partial [Gigaspora margarita]
DDSCDDDIREKAKKLIENRQVSIIRLVNLNRWGSPGLKVILPWQVTEMDASVGIALMDNSGCDSRFYSDSFDSAEYDRRFNFEEPFNEIIQR